MKKLFFTLIIMIFGFGLFAAPVSLESAQKVAVNFYKHISASTKTDFTVSNVVTMEKDGLTTFYAFIFKAGGFVLVSADDAVMPILGYSDSNPFETNNMPSNLKGWLDDYSRQIKFIVESNIDNTETAKEWKDFSENNFSPTKTVIVANLCSTKWNQDSYSAASCPGKCPCGCVALAMSQVLKKWAGSTSATGLGTHAYLEATYGLEAVNFGGTTYAYSSMPNTISSANSSYATLCFHCGVSVNMTYSSSGSGANQVDIPRALIENFNYQPSAECQIYSNFSNADWLTMLENELTAGRPILYAGANTSEGHSFVFDGYETTTGTYPIEFDVNWGWGGTSNGYFAVGALNPTGYTFNLDNQAVVRVCPKSNAPIANFASSTLAPAVASTVDFTDKSTNSPTSWSWTFEGGTPATSTSQNPTGIVYSTAGKYLVSLTVTNGTGSDTKTVSRLINVGGAASAWIQQDLGLPRDNVHYNWMVDGISTCSANIAWATIIDGGSTTHYIKYFSRTTDGGTTWTPDSLHISNSSHYCIANLEARSADTAWAAMYPILSANGGLLAKTVNGGTTWTTSDPGFSTSWLDFVHFFDASHGVCVGDPTSTTAASSFKVFVTSNGGSTWTAATSAPTNTYSSTLGPETGLTNTFDAKGDTIWFGTTMGRVIRSTDYGNTWTAYTSGFTTTAYCYTTPVFRDGKTGIITGTNSAGTLLGVKKTTDGGATWATITPTGFYVKNPIYGSRPGTNPLWVNVANWNGRGSSYSNDNCSTMLNIDTGSVSYTFVKFYDNTNGWAGSVVGIQDGGIYKWNPSILTGINDQPEIKSDQVEIYPNPTNSVINITGINDKAVINVYNLVGERIITKEFNPSSGSLLQLDLSGIVEGIYLISVDTGNKRITKRISLIK